MRRSAAFLLFACLTAGRLPAQSPPPASADPAANPSPAPAPAATTPDSADSAEPDTDALYDFGKALFDAYAPDEIKAQYDFPDRDQWDKFAQNLQSALDQDSLADLARYEPQARAALAALSAFPGYRDYAIWLQDRLDYITAARDSAREPAPPPPATREITPLPDPAAVPHYPLWLDRLAQRPRPADADRLVAQLRPIFAAQGLPDSLVWMAEVESSFDPEARSPVGARGLFQLMPDTARGLGLSLFPFDERAQPEKNARAAATLLRRLHRRFGTWPLTLAAYNAGEGRVSQTLKKHHASTFAEIAPHLPAETQMYVPKVLATVTVRSGHPLAAPSPDSPQP